MKFDRRNIRLRKVNILAYWYCFHLGHIPSGQIYCRILPQLCSKEGYPNSKVYGTTMGPTWVLSAPDGPPVGPMNFAIRVYTHLWLRSSPLSQMRSNQGLYSLSGKTSYRKNSWSLEAARFEFKLFQSLWNLAGTSAALLPRCLSNFRAIRPLQHPISRLRDFTRFGGKTSYRLVNRCLEYSCPITPLIPLFVPIFYQSHYIFYSKCISAPYIWQISTTYRTQ